MAKEIIDAVKEAELSGRYNVDNAKDEAENMVKVEAEELRKLYERKVGEAGQEADEKLRAAESEAERMLREAEAKAVEEQKELWRGSAEKKERAFEAIRKQLFS
ncbi:MAG TPA: hypothetical protein IAB10_01400 [Candidatus Avilachnospira avistercoris]|nr:hypothetical protein [Candidatus Avilachnospira avistercoris]